MRPLTLGYLVLVAVGSAITFNQWLDGALRDTPLPEGHARRHRPEPSTELDGSRLARAFGTSLRPPVPAAPRRATQLKLLGTLDDHAAAVFDALSGQCHTLHVGDAWDDGVLTDIGHGAVTVFREGDRETIRSGGVASAPTPQAAPFSVAMSARGGSVAISRVDLESHLDGFVSEALVSGRVVPSFKEGSVTGLKLFTLRPGGLYDQLGFKNGDVIEEVNGAPIGGMDLGMSALTRLRNQSHVAITVNRNGERLSWELNVK
jgi:hypothetical protein